MLLTSSSVPAPASALSMSRPGSTGPRMHDYSIPTSSGITQVRPGVVSVSTGSSPAPSAPIPSDPSSVPVRIDTYREKRDLSVSSDTWGSPVSSTFGQSYGTAGSWSLPRSSLRSRSASTPKSDEDDGGYVEVDIEGDDAYNSQRYGFVNRGRTSAARSGYEDEDDGAVVDLRDEKIEEEWDGEMEMEM